MAFPAELHNPYRQIPWSLPVISALQSLPAGNEHTQRLISDPTPNIKIPGGEGIFESPMICQLNFESRPDKSMSWQLHVHVWKQPPGHGIRIKSSFVI